MTIRVIEEEPLVLTQEELDILRYEYSRAFQFYCGPMPSFEVWARHRRENTKRVNPYREFQ